MLLQGDLQMVFDALYNLGVIDPVLEMDWVEEMEGIGEHYDDVAKAVETANLFQCNAGELLSNLQKFEEKTLNFLAMEVAREFADYHSRDQLH